MPRTHWLTRLVGALLVLAIALTAAGCGSKTQPQAAPSGPPPVPYVVKVTTVTGKLPPAQRKAVRSRAGTTVHSWWEAAYLRPGPTRTFGAFTPGAAKLAERDADLLSDPDRAHASTEVIQQGVDLDVLAVKRRARGVTARLHLVYDKTADNDNAKGATNRCVVGGTVSLIPVGTSWRIFGYDVTHSCRARKAGS